MYRNFQQNNSNLIISSDNDNGGNNSINFDVDENYEFSGAALKLRNSTSGCDLNQTKITTTISSSVVNNGSSILSGADVLSPPIPGTPLHFGARNNNSSNHKTAIMEGQSNGLDGNDEFSLDSNNKAVTSVDPTKPKIGSPRHFFCFRQGLFEQAVNDCISILLKPSNDVELLGSWLLTEISHWDHEKEKIVILTSKTLLVVKFDFIALRILEHKKILLNKIDTVVKGKLSYPSASIVPERGEIGVRLMWNNGQAIPTTLSWNPFTREIPWRTFTNHPLYSYQEEYQCVPSSQDQLDQNRLIYSIDNFHYAIVRLFSLPAPESLHVNKNCKFNEEQIVSQNYVGLGAVIHNRNNLGFFKVRGKFSF